MKKTGQIKDSEDTEAILEEEASDGEGSLYDGDFEVEQANRKAKRRRKEKQAVQTKKTKRGKAQQLSGLILPHTRRRQVGCGRSISKTFGGRAKSRCSQYKSQN